MCLAIISPTPDKRPDPAGLKRAFDANTGGAGFAYLCTRRKRVIVRKGFMKFDTFQSHYAEALKRAHGPMLVHFRIPTHGSAGAEMTHPFRLPAVGAALIHNGMINLSDKARPHLSDTALFCEKVANYTAAEFRKKQIKLERSIGWSRIAVLYPDGDIVTLGTGWHTDPADGCTYSNRSYTAWTSLYGDDGADPRKWEHRARERELVRANTPPAHYMLPRTIDSTRADYDRAYSQLIGWEPRMPFQSIGRAGRAPGPVREYRIDPVSGLLEPMPARVVRAGHVCDMCKTTGGLCDPDGSGRLCDGGIA